MGAFEYTALDAGGRERKGILEGDTPRQSREQIRQKVLAAMLYPIVLTVMCFGIVSLLLVFVVPKVVAVFETSKAKLPLITRVLIATSGFFRAYGLYLAAAAVIAFVLFRR